MNYSPSRETEMSEHKQTAAATPTPPPHWGSNYSDYTEDQSFVHSV